MQDENKKAAVDFLEMIIVGKIDEAYEKYVDMSGKHHNTHTQAGMEALRAGMKGAGEHFPNAQFIVQHALADGDLVAVHSHLTLKPEEFDFTAVHIMRFTNGKIVEFWDVAEDLKDTTNEDGAF